MITIRNAALYNGISKTVTIQSDESLDIDGTNLTLLPALIDPHVHFRTPGAKHKENWIYGAQAAVKGGVTTVFDMPNTIPHCTTVSALKEKHLIINRQLQESKIPLRYYLYIGADRKHLNEIAKAKDLAIGIKVFMGSSTGGMLIDDDATLDEVFRIASNEDMIVSVHAEDEAEIQKKMLAFGPQTDPAFHSKIRSREAAAIAVERALSFAAKHRTRLCILHVGTKEEIALIKQAKQDGISAYCETSPHHLLLNTSHYAKWGTRVQVNPPLREKEDQEVLWAALNDGTIDFIGTDHAPHTLEEKSLPYGKAPSGIPGIEFLLPLLLNAVNQKKLTLETLVKSTRLNIEKIFRIPSNEDVVLVDLNKSLYPKNKDIKSKCGWSPYVDQELMGAPVYTIIKGKALCHCKKN